MDLSTKAKRQRLTADDATQRVCLLKLPSREPIEISPNFDDDPLEVAARFAQETGLPSADCLEPIAELVPDQTIDDEKLRTVIACSVFFHCVASEIWEKICAYLSFMDLFRCELVSKHFLALAQASWTSSKFACFEVAELLSFDRSVGGDLEGVNTFADEGKCGMGLRRFKCLLSRISERVKELSFTVPESFIGEPCGEHFPFDSAILDMTSLVPQLRRLHFRRVRLASEAIIAIGRLTQLESLSLIDFEKCAMTGLVPPDADAAYITAYSNAVNTCCSAYAEALATAVAPLAQLKELRIIYTEPVQLSGCSLSFLDAVSSSSLRVLEICALKGGNLLTVRDFIHSHVQLVEFSLADYHLSSEFIVLPNDGSPSLIRSLVDCCPNLKRLGLVGLGGHHLDDVHLLHDLESLVLDPREIADFDDDEVIKICKRNPALKKFDIPIAGNPVHYSLQTVALVTKRAYAEGFAQLRHLQSLTIDRSVQLDDCSFEAVIRANSSLREVKVGYNYHLSVASLASLGFHCYLLEKLTFGSGHCLSPYPWFSAAAMRELAKAIAASSAGPTSTTRKRKVHVVVPTTLLAGDDSKLAPPDDSIATGLVTVRVCGRIYEY